MTTSMTSQRKIETTGGTGNQLTNLELEDTGGDDHVHGRMEGWVEEWKDGWMDGRMGGWMDEWKDGRMGGWMEEWVGGCTD